MAYIRNKHLPQKLETKMTISMDWKLDLMKVYLSDDLKAMSEEIVYLELENFL